MSIATALTPQKTNQTFLHDVIQGLSQSPKTLPCKYFYDERGSDLFEKICETQEYYVTRTEMAIYRDRAAEMAALIGPNAQIIEPGAGALKKVSLLLNALQDPLAYTPMDISADFLRQCSDKLRHQFPFLDIDPIAVDFNNHEALIDGLRRRDFDASPRVIFFPGSTIGNFAPAAATTFLAAIAKGLKSGDGLLIGVDLLKSEAVLEAAYNDVDGFTEAFNKNLLRRINVELDSDIDAEYFSHIACFNQNQQRIEMHLRSDREQYCQVGDKRFYFADGETIHTENSYKYSSEDFIALAAGAGFKSETVWMDAEQLFSVHFMRRV